MIEEKTVLILGAGASKPYGFPLAYELRDEIVKDDPYATQSRFLNELNYDEEAYLDFKEDLAHSGYSSVDAFLENRNKWLDIGKYAIAFNLLTYEKNIGFKLFPPHQPKDHWYEVLWQKLSTQSWQKFKENKIHIITFNYDHSLSTISAPS